MQRLHLIELHEQPWFPRSARDAVTDVLRQGEDLMGGYRSILPRLFDAMDAAGTSEVVDLCSGGGGPWPGLLAAAPAQQRRALRITLTDLFPNEDAFALVERQSASRVGRLVGRREPLDATAVPEELRGFRTLFSSFHHFRPEQARAILQDAVDKNVGIGIFEFTERRLPAIVATATFAGPGAVLLSPVLRPLRLSRFWWSLVVPIVPVTLAIDGVVSCLRTYSEEDLRGLVRQVRGHARFEWQIGRNRLPLHVMPITYLIGVPRREDR